MICLDTSVAVSLLVPEPKTVDVKAWFAGLSEIPVSGDWLLTEFESAISIKLRSGELGEDDMGTDGEYIADECHGIQHRAEDWLRQNWPFVQTPPQTRDQAQHSLSA